MLSTFITRILQLIYRLAYREFRF